jgi:hypothetical protein
VLLAIFIIGLVLFFREIFSIVIIWIADAKACPIVSEDIKIQAKSSLPIKIVLSRRNFIEFCSFSTWFNRFFLIDERLWNDLSLEQREALLIWGYSAQIQWSFISRIFKAMNISSTDRDCLVVGAQLESLISVLMKTSDFRKNQSPSELGHLISGLSLIGPSILDPWPSIEAREAKLLGYLADWAKES